VTDREFITEIRHGLIIIMRACIKRYAMAWRDFLPSDVATALFPVAWPTDVDVLQKQP